jgi:hypothetical protein
MRGYDCILKKESSWELREYTHGRTPVHFLAMRGSKSDMKILKDLRVDKVLDFYGNSVLHCLAENGFEYVIEHPSCAIVRNANGDSFKFQ